MKHLYHQLLKIYQHYLLVVVMNLFQQLNDEGVTIIMITHDANIAGHAKKVLHIFDGEISDEPQKGGSLK